MAYSRARRGRSGFGRGRTRSAPARSVRRGSGTGWGARRASPRRTAARGRSSRGQQTVRLVIEQAPASAVSRPNPFARMLGAPQVDTTKPKKARL